MRLLWATILKSSAVLMMCLISKDYLLSAVTNVACCFCLRFVLLADEVVAELMKLIPAELEPLTDIFSRSGLGACRGSAAGGTANLFKAQAQSQEISWFGSLQLC